MALLTASTKANPSLDQPVNVVTPPNIWDAGGKWCREQTNSVMVVATTDVQDSITGKGQRDLVTR